MSGSNWRDGNEAYWIGVEEGGYAAECDRDHWRRHAEALAKAAEALARLDQPELRSRKGSDPLYSMGSGDPITVGDVRAAAVALAAFRESTK